MKKSKHALIRAQQRGILPSHLEIVMQFGTPMEKRDGAIEWRLLERDKKRLIQALDKADHKAILTSRDDCQTVITVYNWK